MPTSLAHYYLCEVVHSTDFRAVALSIAALLPGALKEGVTPHSTRPPPPAPARPFPSIRHPILLRTARVRRHSSVPGEGLDEHHLETRPLDLWADVGVLLRLVQRGREEVYLEQQVVWH